MSNILKQFNPKTEEQYMAIDNCCLFLKVGSALYGTRTENSDDDYLGIFLENEEYILGRKVVECVEFNTNPHSSGKKNQKGDIDCKFYTLRKFIHLAENNNPTILELFFAPKNCILHINSYGKWLLSIYKLFISKKLYHSFKGYSYGQIKRNEIKSGNNTGRKELINEKGFDYKLFSHAIRLYLEAIELLGTGELSFPLKENNKILDIKQGRWTFEQCQEEAKRLEPILDMLYANSQIQYSPDKKSIHELQVNIYHDFFLDIFSE